WTEVMRLFYQRRVRLNGTPCLDAARRPKPGQRLQVQIQPRARSGKRQARTERGKGQRVRKPGTRDQGPTPVIRLVDAHVVVVEKPAGLTTMRHAREIEEFGARARKFLPPTLADLLPALLPAGTGPRRVRAVHRLDRDTSGLVVFARTPEAERHLG